MKIKLIEMKYLLLFCHTPPPLNLTSMTYVIPPHVLPFIGSDILMWHMDHDFPDLIAVPRP